MAVQCGRIIKFRKCHKLHTMGRKNNALFDDINHITQLSEFYSVALIGAFCVFLISAKVLTISIF